MLERNYQAKLIKRIHTRFPGAVVLKNDTDYQQGIPDLLILHRTSWGMLEVKRKEPTSPDDFEPNQEWYLEKFNKMSFGACIYPSNEEEVLFELQQTFRSHR